MSCSRVAGSSGCVGYHRVAARDVDAHVVADPGRDGSRRTCRDRLLLGDPGVRDALMHGNQVCVPDATLLPAGVERIYPSGERLTSMTGLRYCATERSRDGDLYIYDIALRAGDGTVVERWDGLHLRAVRKLDGRGPWVAPLLGPLPGAHARGPDRGAGGGCHRTRRPGRRRRPRAATAGPHRGGRRADLRPRRHRAVPP